MNQKQNPEVQIVMPVYNEQECIASVIMEIYDELSPRVPIEFIVCEDGSQDRTKEVLKQLSQKVPMKLIMSDERKGYSRAVIDGFRAATSAYLNNLRLFRVWWQVRKS